MTKADARRENETRTAPVDARPVGAPSEAERLGGAGKGPQQKSGERGGSDGPEPTRFGDWEVKGRCSDF